MHERLPQLLGAYGTRTTVMIPAGGMRGAVMLDDPGVVRGDELGPCTEVLHWVATIVHHVRDQPVGVV